jgi:hypothetical protein
VRVSPDARDAYASLVTDTQLPDAALVALFHQNREGTERGAIYVMEKRGAGWSFFGLDRDGRAAEAGDECARCHAAGVADSLFGLPRSAAVE